MEETIPGEEGKREERYTRVNEFKGPLGNTEQSRLAGGTFQVERLLE